VTAAIVVEVYAPEPAPDQLSTLIAACSRAAQPNECVTSDMKTGEPPLGVAIVHREGDHARIELGLRGTAQAEWSIRDLSFQPDDDELERYRAIGFAIGTLVARQFEPPPSPEPSVDDRATDSRVRKPPSSPAPPPRVEPPPSETKLEDTPRPPRRALRSTWLELHGTGGLALVPGPPALGGVLRAASELVPGGLFAVVETSYAERVGAPELHARFLDAALGLGQPLLQLRSLNWDVRLSFAVERLAVTAFDGSRQESALRWKPRIAASTFAHVPVSASIALSAGIGTSLDSKQSVIYVGDSQVAETPTFGFNGYIGVRVRLR